MGQDSAMRRSRNLRSGAVRARSSARRKAARASSAAAEPPQEFGPGRVPVLVVRQVELVHDGQRRGRAVGFGDRDRPVQPDHRGAGQLGEPGVEHRDLRPVELLLGLQGGDRRLNNVRPGPALGVGEGSVEQGPALGDLPPVPPRPVLIGQQDQVLAVFISGEPGLPARVVQQHQRQQAEHFGLGREQGGQHPAQPDRLGGQAWPVRIPVSLVEDEVHHGQDRAEAFGQPRAGRHAERDARHLDLGLGPGQPSFHGLGRNQEGPRDLLGGQAAHGAQGQRDLGLDGQGRMAAHEDELESLVRDRAGVHAVLRGVLPRVLPGRGRRRRQQAKFGGQDAIAAQPVDGPAPGRGDQPGRRVVGYAVGRPALRRDREGFRGGVLGEVPIAEVADQRGQHPAPLVAEDLFYQGCSPVFPLRPVLPASPGRSRWGGSPPSRRGGPRGSEPRSRWPGPGRRPRAGRSRRRSPWCRRTGRR